MRCDSAYGMLDAYFDGELGADQCAAVQEHLTNCPQCSSQVAETARLQRALRSARGHFTPSTEFRRKMQKQFARSKPRGWGLPWMPVAVAFASMLILAFVWMGQWRRSQAFAEVADLHVNALASTNQVDVVSTDRHTVKPWFQGKLPFTFNLPELNNTEFTLLGGRMAYFQQHPGAQLLVATHQHKISILILQESPDLQRDFPVSMAVDHRTSFGVESWQSHGLRFVVVSDADPAGIDNLARLLKNVNQ